MTFAIFIVLVLAVFIALINTQPIAGVLGFNLTPAIITIVGYMRAWDWLFPIHELFTFLGIYIGLEIAIYLWKLGIKTVKFIRGHSDGA